MRVKSTCSNGAAMSRHDLAFDDHGRAIITETPLACSPAQMRLALHRAGLLTTVQAIADSDPEASIVWEYATQIMRESPFIAALGEGHFTPAEIDDLFRAAMAVIV